MVAGLTRTVADDLLARLPLSPDAYPHNVDLVRNAILLLRLEPGSYRQASFLDDRMLGPGLKGTWVTSNLAVSALSRVECAKPLHFIFHTGHVGSTLISRLLDETGELLPLREPQSLRSLADAHDTLERPEALLSAAQFQVLLDAFLNAWRRGYADTSAVLLKATSSAGRLAGVLLQREKVARALYVNLRAETCLATLLAGANSALDLRGHGPARLRRLAAQFELPPTPLHAMSPGELAAMSWLTETLTQRDCLRREPDRVMAIDFDEFLLDVPGVLSAIWAHLLLPGTPILEANRLASALARYSKAPEHGYSPALRADLLNDARRSQAAEIRRGRVWLENLARREPAVAAVLST